MSLFIECHLIQNFVPSNLNRDDTGAPKDAIFGGHRRARISSQCFKRAIRLAAHEQKLYEPQYFGVRTLKVRELLAERLAALGRKEADGRIAAALSAAGLKLKDDGKTEFLLFLGENEIAKLASLIDEHWSDLAVAPEGEKKTKKAAKAAAPPEVVKQVKTLLDGGKAVDIALFGRMLADLPEANQDAACQVAHAISTHRVEREFDYFTAVDDKGSPEETGAGMIGQIEFNSAAFYRYAVIDVTKLVENLQGDRELALTAVKAFVEAMARAIPTGKQNTFAAHNPPSFVGLALRHKSPLNLANAFEKPIYARQDKPLSTLSVEALAEYEAKLSAVYGNVGDSWATLDLTGAWSADKGAAQTSLSSLSAWVQQSVSAELEA